MATNRISPKKGKVVDIPTVPTVGTATTGAALATLTYTAATVGGPVTTFTALSNPGSITGTGTSPITVSGLTPGTAYTFTVRGTNATGSSEYSSASNSITPTDPAAYESIQTYTLSTATASVTFSSIPATYKHLQIRYLAKTSRAAVNDYAKLEINTDTTTTNYRSHTLNGDGSSAYAGTTANAIEIGGFPGNTNASMFGVGVLDFLDYTNTNKYKTIRTLDGFDQNSASTGAGYVALESGLWMSTSAITSIKFTSGTSSNFVQYSSFALYGIKGA